LTKLSKKRDPAQNEGKNLTKKPWGFQVGRTKPHLERSGKIQKRGWKGGGGGRYSSGTGGKKGKKISVSIGPTQNRVGDRKKKGKEDKKARAEKPKQGGKAKKRKTKKQEGEKRLSAQPYPTRTRHRYSIGVKDAPEGKGKNQYRHHKVHTGRGLGRREKASSDEKKKFQERKNA